MLFRNRSTSNSLILALHTKGHIRWSDALNGGHVQRLLWMGAKTSPWIDGDLRSPPAPQEDAQCWWCLRAYWTIGKAIRDGHVIDHGVHDWLCKIPMASARIPLLILFCVVGARAKDPGIDLALIELAKHPLAPADERWLRASLTADVFGGAPTRWNVDILSEATTLLTSRGPSLPQDVQTACRAQIDHLLLQRAALPPLPTKATEVGADKIPKSHRVH